MISFAQHKTHKGGKTLRNLMQFDTFFFLSHRFFFCPIVLMSWGLGTFLQDVQYCIDAVTASFCGPFSWGVSLRPSVLMPCPCDDLGATSSQKVGVNRHPSGLISNLSSLWFASWILVSVSVGCLVLSCFIFSLSLNNLYLVLCTSFSVNSCG